MAVGAVWFVSPASADVTPSVNVSPSSVAAGGTVTVSGQCPSFSSHVFVFGGYQRIEGELNGTIRVPVAVDGSYSTPFTVPQESPGGKWVFMAQCDGGDELNFAAGPVDIDVAAGTVAPLTLAVSPDPLVTGHPVNLSGTGCVVNGRALDMVRVFLDDPGRRNNGYGSAEVTPDQHGAWHATIDLYDVPFPQNHPVLVYVDCIDGQETQPLWERTTSMNMTMTAPTSVSSTTTSTSVTSTTTTVFVVPQAPPVMPTSSTTPPQTSSARLPETGASNPGLSAAAAALIAMGTCLAAVQRRRRSH